MGHIFWWFFIFTLGAYLSIFNVVLSRNEILLSTFSRTSQIRNERRNKRGRLFLREMSCGATWNTIYFSEGKMYSRVNL